MNVVLYTAPTIEPITLADLKMHLRVDSETFDGNLTLTQCLPYASNGISALGAYTHVGTGVDVLGKQAVVQVHHGTNGATGTVDTKIQEADALAGPYTDWTGGAFTQVTTANDNADYKLPYTGTKQYIRTVSKVLLAACDFGTSILVNAATTAEDADLTTIIKAGRIYVEEITRRALLTQVWDYYLSKWPSDKAIKLPFGNLQNAVGTAPVVSWKDEDGTETTLTVTTDYLVETNGEGIGRIVLPADTSWPSDALYPSNPIKIRFTCGWTAASEIPATIVAAVKLICADLHENREAQIVAQRYETNPTVQRLLASSRLWGEFL